MWAILDKFSGISGVLLVENGHIIDDASVRIFFDGCGQCLIGLYTLGGLF